MNVTETEKRTTRDTRAMPELLDMGGGRRASSEAVTGPDSRSRKECLGGRCLGEGLLELGTVSASQLARARALTIREGLPLSEALLQLEFLSRPELLEALSRLWDTPAGDLAELPGDPLVLDLLPKGKALDLQALPLFLVENQLTVAMSDPADLRKIDELQFITGMQVLPVLSLEKDLQRYLVEYYGEAEQPEFSSLAFEASSEDNGETNAESGAAELERKGYVSLDAAETDRPIVRLVNLIIVRAIQEGASDIHIEPMELEVRIRYRVDGCLHTKPYKIQRSLLSPLISRVKILSNLDISERRVPQDGKIRARYEGRDIDFRVSVNPTIRGEKIVLRILDKTKMNFQLETIGMAPCILEPWLDLIRRPEGILLVTGPTGSGKSSTLYATLRRLDRPEVNIVTVEDPVEYELDGIAQCQVETRKGYTFSAALRSFLRQDPDVILVGEIRDEETASIAVQAAQTGHLVLSTLHTNDAPSTIIRLGDIGVPRYMLASSLLGILAQRLIRCLCPHCRYKLEPEEHEARILRDWISTKLPFLDGAGCEHCLGTGYRGRTGVHELLRWGPDLQSLATSEATAGELARAAVKTGYRPLWWDGLDKVRKGETSFRELLRVAEPPPDFQADPDTD